MMDREAFRKMELKNQILKKENKQLKEQLAHYQSLYIKTTENLPQSIAKEEDDI